MKKLLALILCVMMFVSVIPTSAFAGANDSKAMKSLLVEQAAAQQNVTNNPASPKPDYDNVVVPKETAVKTAEADLAAKKEYLSKVSAAGKAQAQADVTAAENALTTAKNDLAAAKAQYNTALNKYNKGEAAQKELDIVNAKIDLLTAQENAGANPSDADLQNIAALQAALNALIGNVPSATYDVSKVDPKADPKLKADLENAAAYKKQVEKMIENTKKNVATAYGALAMNQVVYASAKSMDDVVGGLVDKIADMLSGKTVNGHKMSSADVKAFKDAHKASVRSVIEDIVISELEDNEYKYLDKDGKVDPLKYGQVVADAVNAALNNKDFQAGYQAVATYYAMMNVADSINEELKKQRDEFKDSIDMSFDKDFAGHYARLADEYIDTLTEVGAFDGNNDPWTAYITPEVGNWD